MPYTRSARPRDDAVEEDFFAGAAAPAVRPVRTPQRTTGPVG